MTKELFTKAQYQAGALEQLDKAHDLERCNGPHRPSPDDLARAAQHRHASRALARHAASMP